MVVDFSELSGVGKSSALDDDSEVQLAIKNALKSQLRWEGCTMVSIGVGEGRFRALELTRYLTPNTCVSVVALERYFVGFRQS